MLWRGRDLDCYKKRASGRELLVTAVGVCVGGELFGGETGGSVSAELDFRFRNPHKGRMWQRVPVILLLGRQRQEDP